jgi:fatty acid desaturase
VPVWKYFVVLAGFGVMWSAMQYVHHFGTERDVQKGALNLRTSRLLDLLWLNHNWHLNHHLSPTVPWLYLPQVSDPHSPPRGQLLLAYLRMWRGPRFTHVRVQNRHAGKIIR